MGATLLSQVGFVSSGGLPRGVGPLATSGASESAATLALVRGLGFGAVLAATAVLLVYLFQYRNQVLAKPYQERWRYLAVGVGAAAVYAVSGLVETVGTNADLVAGARTFRLGATLFFFLFAAVGVRAMYRTATGGHGLVTKRELPNWVLPSVLAGFVVTWWAAYLFGPSVVVGAVETVGLAGAVAYTLAYAVATVRAQEGTSIAAVTRQFTPALVAFAVVVVAEQASFYGLGSDVVATSLVMVGRVLAAAFLFATAVAIRQQGGEVSRLYDPTTWRGNDGANYDSATD
ncbi:hypothetical protein [Halorientalis salina]|uniref:hypothetical protein n=1 Tax=Halorientalis salina TaxID=2932266 RepID=UPI0010ABDA25|nr:hypothetical protein [Halorientalis salina]